jgi:capsular polysaccharide transport system permease protein
MSRSANAVAVQVRVIHALLMREVITRYGRHNVGFLWLFFEPMMFTLGVAALWSMGGKHIDANMPVIAFAVTGYSSVLLWRNMPGRCVNAIEPNRSLLYHRQVRIIDVFAARVLLEWLGVTTSFVLLTATFTAMDWMKLPQDVFKVVLAWIMLGWFGAALGLLLGALSSMTELVEKLWHPASYLLFPLSGAAFMVEWLPASAQKVILLLPMVHGVELLRDGFFGSAERTHYDLFYMFCCNLALTVAALAQERIASTRVVPE